MEIVYGGVHLTMLTVDEFVGESVYDDSGVDYLYTRYLIRGSTVVNGQAEVREIAGPPVSYKKTTDKTTLADFSPAAAPPGVVRPPAPGHIAAAVNNPLHDGGVFYDPFGRGVFGSAPPGGIYSESSARAMWYAIEKSPQTTPTTDIAIRQRLRTPRQHLFVFTNGGDPVAGELLLRSPAAFNVHCDAKNGPIPRVWGFRRSMGDAATLLCEFEIETFVCEPDVVEGNNNGPLLSNRWSMRHTADETGLTRIQVEGAAHFRTDWLYGGSVPGSTGFPESPDDYRLRLFLPVPFGHVRENIVVEGIPDVSGVRYSFTDRLQMVNFPAGPYAAASRISAVHRQTIVSEGDLLRKSSEVLDRTLGRVLNKKWIENSGESGDDSLASSLKALASAIRGMKK